MKRLTRWIRILSIYFRHVGPCCGDTHVQTDGGPTFVTLKTPCLQWKVRLHTAWVKVESVKCEDRLIFAQLLIVLVRKHRLQHRHFDTSVLQFWHSPCWKIPYLNILRNKKRLEVPLGAFNKVAISMYKSLNWGTLKSPLNYRRTIPWYAHF